MFAQDEAPASEEEADYQLDFPEYMSDDFRVNSFKVGVLIPARAQEVPGRWWPRIGVVCMGR